MACSLLGNVPAEEINVEEQPSRIYLEAWRRYTLNILLATPNILLAGPRSSFLARRGETCQFPRPEHSP